MMRRFIPLFVLWLIPASLFAAAQTGDLRVQIVDADGKPVEGAAVSVSGDNVLGVRNSKSDGGGEARVLALPPGPVDVRVEREGYLTELRNGVSISLDRTTTVKVTLQLPTVETAMVVTVEARVIDTTSAAVDQTVGRSYIEKLPVARTFQDVIRTLPGVSGRVDFEDGGPSGGNPSVRGEGQYGNNYLLDGFSTRDPSTHTFGSDINIDAVEELHVFLDGAPAEYGGATGMIANVVSKSGTDTFHGGVGFNFSGSASCAPYDFRGDETAACAKYDLLDTSVGAEVPTRKRRFIDARVYGSLGGPIIKEKLHFFTAFEFGGGWTQPEGVGNDAEGNPLRRRDIGHALFGKVSFSPIPQVLLSYSYLNNAAGFRNYDTDPLTAAEAQTNRKDRDWAHNLQGRFFLTDSLVLEAKGTLAQTRIDVVPASGNTNDPSYRDIITGARYGNADADYNRRARQGFGVSLTKWIRRALGDHEVKFGFEWNHVRSEREILYSGGYQYVTAEGVGPDGVPGTDDDADPVSYTEYTNVGRLGHSGGNPVFYLQDKWNPWPFLTVSLGARVEGVRLLQNEGNEAVNQWFAAPRLGVSVDPTRDGKTQIAFSAGRYYDANAVDFAGWADTRSAAVYRQYDWDPAAQDYVLVWEQDPASNPANFDAKLKPYYADRLTISGRREIVETFAVGARVVLSQTMGIPEDVFLDLDEFSYQITNPKGKRRRYAALEIVAEKKLGKGFQLLASYTLSAARGTTPGNFDLPSGSEIGSDGNEVGVFYDTPGDPRQRAACLEDPDCAWLVDGLDGMGYTHTDESGNTTYNVQGYDGYLPYHSFHNLKLNASYTMPWNTTVGLVMEVDSGHAWQKRGWVELYADYYGYPEGRGSRFAPPQFYLDLHLGQAIDIKGTSLNIGFDVFNLFGLKAPITLYENDDPMFGMVRYRQSPRSVRLSVGWTF